VASDLLVRSPLPVIIVTPRYRAGRVADVYYASDLENFASEFRKVRGFADSLKASLGILHYDYMYMSRSTLLALESKYSKYVTPGVRLLFRKRHSDATLAECIRKDLKKEKPQLLILFTRLSRGWFRRLFSVSRTQQLALHPTVPLMVFRKKDA
jgi:nucleotide-binding universal stress UspA family protein